MGTGIWSFTAIEQHYTQLRSLITVLRDRAIPIRLLSDVSHGQRQATWVEDYILEQMRMTFSAGDRIALLAGSDADRAHLSSRAEGVDVAVFASRQAAERWLSEG